MAATLSSGGHPNSNMPGRRKEDDVNLVAFHLTQDPISGDVAPAMSRGNRQGTATIGVATFEPDSLSTFVPSGTEPTRYASGVRRLTPRECERLQGFPDDWTLIPWKGKPSPDNRRYAALGNAVTVQVAEWIGHRIAAADLALRGPGADTAEAAA